MKTLAEVWNEFRVEAEIPIPKGTEFDELARGIFFAGAVAFAGLMTQRVGAGDSLPEIIASLRDEVEELGTLEKVSDGRNGDRE